MKKFEYSIVLKKAYMSIMKEEKEEVIFTMEAESREIADRAVKALLEGAKNKKDILCLYVSE